MPKLVPIRPKLGFEQRDYRRLPRLLQTRGRKKYRKGLLRKILNDIQLPTEEYDKLRRK
ncbi:MAG: hypothetical protein WC604_05070 [Candidatus Gracilibacteria bacterium]